ncbi:MAG: hypothetical protein AB1567_13365, partial [bacterium]
KDNWKHYPRQMLRSRVISEGVRTVLPGCNVGFYTVEEVQDFAPSSVIEGSVVEEVVEEVQSSQQKNSDTTPKPTNHFEKFLKEMAKIKEQVGEKVYYNVIGNFGFEHANQITTRKDQVTVYKALEEYLPTKLENNKIDKSFEFEIADEIDNTTKGQEIGQE